MALTHSLNPISGAPVTPPGPGAHTVGVKGDKRLI